MIKKDVNKDGILNTTLTDFGKDIRKDHLAEGLGKPQTITLDDTKIFNDYKGHKNYGGQSDGELSYDTVDKSFSFDIHGCTSMPGEKIFIRKKTTGETIEFKLVKTDKSEGDIFGWHYKSVNSRIPCTLFIIND